MASPVVQWLKIYLAMQGTPVWSLVQEDPTCHSATKPIRHSYWACTQAHEPQLLKEHSRACTLQREATAMRNPDNWRIVPTLCSSRKDTHRNENPVRPNKEKSLPYLSKFTLFVFIFQYSTQTYCHTFQEIRFQINTNKNFSR